MNSSNRLTLLIATALLFAAFQPVNASPDSFWPMVSEQDITAAANHPLLTGGTVPFSGLVNRDNGAPIRVSGSQLAGRISGEVNRTSLLTYVDSHPEVFHLPSAELEILHSGDVLEKQYLTARQKIDGRPVLGTTVLLRVARNGEIALYGADVEASQRNLVWGAAIGVEQAADALSAFSEMEHDGILSAAEVWVRMGGELIPAYELGLSCERPDQRPYGLIAAKTGEILGYYNNVQHADLEGTVTGPMYPIQVQEPLQRVPFSFQRVVVDGQVRHTDEEGAFTEPGFDDEESVSVTMSLRGPWVDVQNDDQANAFFDSSLVAPWTGELGWRNFDHGRIDEFNMFYHTVFINQYYDVLDPGFTGMDYPVPATVGYGNNYDNAFWNGFGMFYGTGSQFNNLALFSDVIYHEYTHGVTGNMYPSGVLPYTGQPGAMNEAWSDYFPCSIHNHSTLSPGIMVGGGNAPLRDLNNTRRYPENWVNEVHGDGLIIGGAMWRMRNLIGEAEFSDSLVHYAKYGFANTFLGYLVELLIADDDNAWLEDGTPHSPAIYEAFGIHGIGPGSAPNLVLHDVVLHETTQDGVLSPGEWVDLQVILYNDVFLYPPPARDVTITVDGCDALLWEQTQLVAGDLGPGEVFDLPAAFTLQVAADTDTRYDWVRVTITANEGEYSIVDSFRVTLGVPEILLVNDDYGFEYAEYYARALHSVGSAAREVKSQDLGSVASMLDYPYVIWFTGNAINPITQQAMLVDYVEGGGNLLLTGQHIGAQLAGLPDLRELIGVEEYFSGLDEYGGRGVAGEPISEGLQFAIVGASGANNQIIIGGVNPLPGSRPLLEYFRSESIAAVYNEPAGGGRVAFFTFGIEAVTGISITNSAGEILAAVLSAMGYTSVEQESQFASELPGEFRLEAPYPNPFNPSTRIAFSLPVAGHVRMTVYNMLGQEVLRALDGVRAPGRHEITLNLGEFGSGSYLVRVENDKTTLTQRMVLVK